INEALRQHIQASREPLEETLRKVVREELERIDRWLNGSGQRLPKALRIHKQLRSIRCTRVVSP
ncbi:MAG: hypothetical protein AAFW84_22580, partial [Cyanobacteria bacterium J06635_15]